MHETISKVKEKEATHTQLRTHTELLNLNYFAFGLITPNHSFRDGKHRALCTTHREDGEEREEGKNELRIN